MAKQHNTRKQPLRKAGPDEERKLLKEATGTKERNLQLFLASQVQETLWLPEGLPKDAQATNFHSAFTMLRGIKPTDEVEGMLATQMVATHNAAMECLRRAMIPAQSFEGRDQNLKHASKLLSIYSRQIEVLNKNRGKGQQKVTVEYVYVESGGQAIVGHVETGKTDGHPRRSSKARTKAIDDDPGEVIDMELEEKKPRRKS